MRTKKERMGHILHHQGLNLDEEMLHAEREQDRGREERGRMSARCAIVVGRFYEDLAERLIAGAQAALADGGAPPADVFDVPGAFELPMAAQLCAQSGRYDARHLPRRRDPRRDRPLRLRLRRGRARHPGRAAAHRRAVARSAC